MLQKLFNYFTLRAAIICLYYEEIQLQPLPITLAGET